MARQQVTINKGGQAERTLYVDEVQIPDMWHVAMAIKTGQPIIKERRDEVANQVLACWHLAHSLKRHIQDQE